MKKIGKSLYFISIIIIFILAFVLRIKTYLLARPPWHDECSLAVNILTRNCWEFFRPLAHSQKAPVVFMMLVKIFSYLLGVKELGLRFIPFVSGLLSVFVFYFFSKRILVSKTSILAANFLFAINYELIYYSQEFKQYSFDVLLFMINILIFAKLDLQNISYKKCLLFSLVSLLFVLASFPCAFVVGVYVLFCILNKINAKKILLFNLPLIISYVFYYFMVLHNMQANEVAKYSSYWNMGFLKLNIYSLLSNFKENFNFFFTPNNFVLIGIVLFSIGLILLCKNKNKINQIILLSFLGIILASFLKIYPIWQRTALYLLPIFILFISKPLDLISKDKKIASFIIIVLFLMCFSKYNFPYIKNFFKDKIFVRTETLTIFPKLVEKYNSDDILIINSSTKADFIYYSEIYEFKPRNVVLAVIKQYDKKYYYNVMNALPKEHTYWFIFGWENSLSKHLNEYVKEFHLKVLEKYQANDSILIKIKI